MFAYERSLPNTDAFLSAFAEIPYDLRHGIVLAPPSPPWTPLTLLTSLFVHGDILHVAFNMLFLLVFGPRVEHLCGHVRFLALYLIAGIVGALAQFASNVESHVPTVGASGAIAGVLGAYVIAAPLGRRLPAIVVIGVWAAAQFASGFDSLGLPAAGGGTAYFAHIGGLCAGVFLAIVFKLPAIRIST